MSKLLSYFRLHQLILVTFSTLVFALADGSEPSLTEHVYDIINHFRRTSDPNISTQYPYVSETALSFLLAFSVALSLQMKVILYQKPTFRKSISKLVEVIWYGFVVVALLYTAAGAQRIATQLQPKYEIPAETAAAMRNDALQGLWLACSSVERKPIRTPQKAEPYFNFVHSICDQLNYRVDNKLTSDARNPRVLESIIFEHCGWPEIDYSRPKEEWPQEKDLGAFPHLRTTFEKFASLCVSRFQLDKAASRVEKDFKNDHYIEDLIRNENTFGWLRLLSIIIAIRAALSISQFIEETIDAILQKLR
ncbi:hypothetical protein [Pseudooceanicola nitratireducens]|uniref:hypothetical protein n=1 Tax=Pseudooceanicola nitratireducens TaxID=517719 RepID=UPI00351588E7